MPYFIMFLFFIQPFVFPRVNCEKTLAVLVFVINLPPDSPDEPTSVQLDVQTHQGFYFPLFC